MKSFIALLPMKGHSERVPSKNIKSFNGRPLFEHVLKTLLECPSIKKVYVDTDSDLISEMVQRFSNEVGIIARPKGIQGDFVSMNEIINYDLSVIKDEDLFVQTHSTNPLLTSKTLEKACSDFLQQRDFDSLFTVTRHQSRFYDQAGKALNHHPQELLRTQDLPPLYEENSCFYFFSRDSFMSNQQKRIGKNPLMYEIPKLEAFDIDTPEDFLVAESVARTLSKADR